MRRTRTTNKPQYMTKKIIPIKETEPEKVDNSTFFTQQWLSADVAKILQKSSIANPEFDVHVLEKEWHEDADLVLIRLTFRNCGRNLYTQRLVLFLIKSLHKN